MLSLANNDHILILLLRLKIIYVYIYILNLPSFICASFWKWSYTSKRCISSYPWQFLEFQWLITDYRFSGCAFRFYNDFTLFVKVKHFTFELQVFYTLSCLCRLERYCIITYIHLIKLNCFIKLSHTLHIFEKF